MLILEEPALRAIALAKHDVSDRLKTRTTPRFEERIDLRPSVKHNRNAVLFQIRDKGKYTLTRKRFQAGSVRLRTDRGPAYWRGFYWDDIITEAGKTVRKRFVANLRSLKEVPNEKVARQKLAAILNPINDVKHSQGR
jgi:hypothetical protein